MAANPLRELDDRRPAPPRAHPYREIGRQAVHYTLDRAGIEHTDEEVVGLVAQIERLKPFSDVVDALALVKAAERNWSFSPTGTPTC
ncbi:hypothetical protein ACFQY7_06115 [Actinomadura luteofluorescens]|uniref:hypothetical protein n=1 Tax=Actinomadura luteofluorescens TaxID=46163 RepID=UPI0036276739